MHRRLAGFTRLCILAAGAGFFPSALAQDAGPRVHGLWVWKIRAILETPRGPETLRDFCRKEGINEVYVSFSGAAGENLAGLIARLHRSHIKVEALLSSPNADQPGKHRETVLDRTRAVVRFNARHPKDPFDGIHLDIEPQQRPEHKGAGNLRFVPALVATYRKVLALAVPAGMAVNADIPIKLLNGSFEERKMLLSALPRLTLMLYGLTNPSDRDSGGRKIEKLHQAARRYMNAAYQGLNVQDVARMSIGLRLPDYGDSTPNVLASLDRAFGTDPHYLGWAWHSYADVSMKR